MLFLQIDNFNQHVLPQSLFAVFDSHCKYNDYKDLSYFLVNSLSQNDLYHMIKNQQKLNYKMKYAVLQNLEYPYIMRETKDKDKPCSSICQWILALHHRSGRILFSSFQQTSKLIQLYITKTIKTGSIIFLEISIYDLRNTSLPPFIVMQIWMHNIMNPHLRRILIFPVTEKLQDLLIT